MGCISSKKTRSELPELNRATSSSSSANESRSNGKGRVASSLLLHAQAVLGPLEKIKEEPEEEEEEVEEEQIVKKKHSGNLKALKRGSSHGRGVFSFKFGRLTEGEHVAAGWPAWLSALAGEAVEGWLPLRSDSFERLEKIGQGTYSDVYRARDLETGKIVAVKKVGFDNFQPESVRFMAREIVILRQLDHPNVMKLEGIITSRLSSHIYLVFEYMEHDLAGLLSSPDVKFTHSQIKCYMRQLLSGVEHCHSRGILHRDIKTSNILVNNEGILKVSDFGLANFMKPKNKQPLTSRVVTLWYRAPELLLGSTKYGEAIDLWSVGCVFAELFIGRPLLKGRTEVEQLHKIFKLCGSPPEDYWKRSRLPLANMFKPQHLYESTLRERCKELPKSAVILIGTFLSVEPYRRGTAASALESKYFNTKPYACDPETLPKYPPSKEIDAKNREERRRTRAGGTAQVHAGSRNHRRVRKTLQESTEFFEVVQTEEAEVNQTARRNQGGSANAYRRRTGVGSRTSLKQSYDTVSEASQLTQESQGSHGSTTRSVPVQASTSSAIAWPKRQKQRDVFARLYDHPTSRSHKQSALETPSLLLANDASDPDGLDHEYSSGRMLGNEAAKCALHWEHEQLHEPDSFGSSQDSYLDNGNSKKKRVGFSGPVIYQSPVTVSREHSQPIRPRSRFYEDL